MIDVRKGGWLLGVLLAAAACSNGGSKQVDAGATTDLGGAPSQATDTNPSNPHVTETPHASPNGPPVMDCVGGPCAAPKVCVNLDFLFVACVVCGGNDQVCCPPFAASDPFLGNC